MSHQLGNPLAHPTPEPGRSSRRTFLASGTVAAGASPAGALTPGAAVASSGGGSGIEPTAWPDGPGRPNRPQRADATLRRILDDIDPDRIRHTIETLVGFGTRHTLSTQTDPKRGIGAARDWIFHELQGYAAASGGRMSVEIRSKRTPAVLPVPG